VCAISTGTLSINLSAHQVGDIYIYIYILCVCAISTGTLSFSLSAHQVGVATLTVNFTRVDVARPANLVSLLLELDVVVLPVNRPPTARLPPVLSLAQGCGAVALPGFAAGVTVGPPHEAWQTPSFAVRLETGQPAVWAAAPAIDAAGTLTLAVADGAVGSGRLSVWLSDDGGTWLGGRNRSRDVYPWIVTYTIYPAPTILAVAPALVPRAGNVLVSVRGLDFGARRNRPYPPEPDGTYKVDLRVGGGACLGGSFVSDSLATCRLPPGQGLVSLSLGTDSVSTLGPTGAVLQSWPRGAVAAAAVRYADVYVGGVTAAADGSAGGLAGFGWDWVDPDYGAAAQAPLRLQTAGAPALSRGVRAIEYYGGQVFLGGSFRSGLDASLSYLVAWDGSRTAPAGGGVDGAVYALARFPAAAGGAALVVGGAFTRLYGGGGAATLVTGGGLAVWNGTGWGWLGGGLRGIVTCLAVDGTSVYVGGKLSRVGIGAAPGGRACDDGGECGGVVVVAGVAVYRQGTGWAGLGGGVPYGDVLGLAVAPFGLLVVGDFVTVGDKTANGPVDVSNVARWEPDPAGGPGAWYPMSGFDGPVRAAAVAVDAGHGARVFVGGDFGSAGYGPVGRLAQLWVPAVPGPSNGTGPAAWNWTAAWTEGGWTRVGGGLNGTVQRLLAVRGCVYVGGSFGAVSDWMGVRPAQSLARWCTVPAAAGAFPSWTLTATATVLLASNLTNFTANTTRAGAAPASFASPAAQARFVSALAAAVSAPAPFGAPPPPVTAAVAGLTLDRDAGRLLAAVRVSAAWQPMGACAAADAAQCVTWRYSGAVRGAAGPDAYGAAVSLDVPALSDALLRLGLATGPAAAVGLAAVNQSSAPAPAPPAESYVRETRARAARAERWEVVGDPAGPAFRDVLAVADGNVGA
jgi:hypothetical protein